jgi:NADP-dependent 3-hydroxy acid dehydrogenase YdfG
MLEDAQGSTSRKGAGKATMAPAHDAPARKAAGRHRNVAAEVVTPEEEARMREQLARLNQDLAELKPWYQGSQPNSISMQAALEAATQQAENEQLRAELAASKQKIEATEQKLEAAEMKALRAELKAANQKIEATEQKLAEEAEARRAAEAMTAGKPLDGRTMIVTGGSSGIGRAIARMAAARGARVVVFDERETPLEGGAATTEDTDIELIRGDVTSQDSLEAAVTEVVRRWGRLDVWVNNACIDLTDPPHNRKQGLSDTTSEDFRRVLDVNLHGYFLGAKVAAAQFVQQEPLAATKLRGKVINISSQHGMVACPGNVSCARASPPIAKARAPSRTPVLRGRRHEQSGRRLPEQVASS